MQGTMRRSLLPKLACLLLCTLPAQAWWETGHRTTARLAAYYLTPAARARIAAILNVPNTSESISDGLASVSTWADDVRKARPNTAPWHFIDLALQDKRSQIPERCPEQNCVTARITMYSSQLVRGKSASDAAADAEALKFLVHFVGDVHQPLHASSDADLGGNCEPLAESYEKARNLHALWDGPVVNDINKDDRALAATLKQDLDRMTNRQRRRMRAGTPDDWAWQSHILAIEVVYKRLSIPTALVSFPASCKVAPAEIVNDKITVQAAYVKSVEPAVRLQLERAGLRLAELLNQL